MRCSYLNFDILIKAVVKKGAKKIVILCTKEIVGKSFVEKGLLRVSNYCKRVV